MKNAWKEHTSDEVLDWLLEEDSENTPVRFLTLRDLIGHKTDSRDLENAKDRMMNTGLIPAILSKQQPDGYWDRADNIYYNKYTGTCWQISMLAQMGADGSNEQIKHGCEYLIEQSVGDYGGLSMNRRQSGAAHCLQGNLAAALVDLGYANDPRVNKAVDWMARSVTGEGFAESKGGEAGINYLRSGISGPGFLCSANNHEPCAWGAVKVAMALSKIPDIQRTITIEKTISACIEFLVSVDPATVNYPHPYAAKASTSWYKFGFPVFYITDLLQILEALVGLGLENDPILQNAIDLVLAKRDQRLRWPMEYSYNGKTWVEIEEKSQPSKWVTLRALRMLKGYYA